MMIFIHHPIPLQKEYTSKSLWKEDEVYIKNVMKVYFEHETEIKKTSGSPSWDYATTMDRFDESFLMVPVVESGRVVSVLKVPRHGKKVYFIYTSSPEEIDFFQNLIYSKIKRALNTEVNGEASKLSCITKSISVWLPDSESNPDGPGQWSTHHITTCTNQHMDQCLGVVMPDGQCLGGGDGGDGDGGGYDYPGGGDNNPDPEDQEDPCQKTKGIITNPVVKAKIDDLKTKSTGTLENAYKFNSNGQPSNLIVGKAHSVNFGDKTGYQGGYHNHTTGISMLSPKDIEQLLQFALAQGNYGDPSNAYVGMVAPNGIHYVIQFSGNYDDALVGFSQEDLDKFSDGYADLASDLKETLLYGSTYINSNGSINSLGVETLFLTTLKKMGLEGKVNLQRIETSGIIQNINLDNNNIPKAVPCS